MAIYPSEIDGVKGWTNVIVEKKSKLDREEMQQSMSPKLFELWLKEQEELEAQTVKPDALPEDLALLASLSVRTKALTNLEKTTRLAREQLAVNLLVRGEDAQKIFDACEIPIPANFIQWVSKRDDVSKEQRDAANQVKTPKQKEEAGVTF